MGVYAEGSHSGLVRPPAKRVSGFTGSRVRISPPPPLLLTPWFVWPIRPPLMGDGPVCPVKGALLFARGRLLALAAQLRSHQRYLSRQLRRQQPRDAVLRRQPLTRR